MKKLMDRYNMHNKQPFVKKIVLPHSRAEVKVVCCNAAGCIESLLTDPRLTDKDFAFFDNDPLAPPPENPTYIGELNTGEAYRAGYKQFKTKPNQLPVGIQWYIDGAVTGQFDNLQITALKMTLSIFTREYRMKDHAWRTLGYVVNYSKPGTRGKKMFVESRHIDSEVIGLKLKDNAGEQVDNKDKAVEKAQDFHSQLATILETYLDVEANGMLWDLHYRRKVHNLELIFFTIMVRCDTDEAEQLCGKYRSRSGNVKCFCRYCTCPNSETDNHMACYPFKTVSMIQELIDADDDVGFEGNLPAKDRQCLVQGQV